MELPSRGADASCAPCRALLWPRAHVRERGLSHRPPRSAGDAAPAGDRHGHPHQPGEEEEAQGREGIAGVGDTPAGNLWEISSQTRPYYCRSWGWISSSAMTRCGPCSWGCLAWPPCCSSSCSCCAPRAPDTSTSSWGRWRRPKRVRHSLWGCFHPIRGTKHRGESLAECSQVSLGAAAPFHTAPLHPRGFIQQVQGFLLPRFCRKSPRLQLRSKPRAVPAAAHTSRSVAVAAP